MILNREHRLFSCDFHSEVMFDRDETKDFPIHRRKGTLNRGCRGEGEAR